MLLNALAEGKVPGGAERTRSLFLHGSDSQGVSRFPLGGVRSFILAIDLDKYNSVFCGLDTSAGEAEFRTAKTTLATLRTELLRRPVDRVVIEACTSAAKPRSDELPAAVETNGSPRSGVDRRITACWCVTVS